MQSDAAVRDARRIEQVIDHAHHVAHLSLHDASGLLSVAFARAGPRQQMHRVAQRGQRVAQLVRQHRQELVLAAIRLDERLLGFLQVGDVERRADHADEVAIRVQPRRRHRLHPAVHPIGAAHAHCAVKPVLRANASR